MLDQKSLIDLFSTKKVKNRLAEGVEEIICSAIDNVDTDSLANQFEVLILNSVKPIIKNEMEKYLKDSNTRDKLISSLLTKSILYK